MKVLMFGWEFPPHISGGLGTACLGLTRGFTACNDVELTFVVPKRYGDETNPGIKIIGAQEIELSVETILRYSDTEMYQFNEFIGSVSAYITPEQYQQYITEITETRSSTTVAGSKAKFSFTGKYGADLYTEIRRYGIVASQIATNEPHDIIHAHDWLTYPAGIEAKRVSGKPLVVHVHATEFDRSGENYNPYVYAIEQKGMQTADCVITVSDFTRKIVIEKYGIDPNKVVTLHNAVEPPEVSFEPSEIQARIPEKIVTFLGRITRQKGPEYFIEAASKVLQRMDNVRFVMAGSGDMMDKMVKQVAKLGIADKFHFTGFLKGDDVTQMYSMSDLYIMPSVSEPFGISPLEAIQNNVPVIISKQSGVSEVINGAIKIDFWDVDAMADAIYAVLNYLSLSVHLKQNGREEVDNMTWNKVALKLRDIYYLTLKS